jgi:hypothetical protein
VAVNEKVVYASRWTSHGKQLFRPGEVISGRMPDYALRSAMERGLTTESHAEAERAKGAEQQRQRDVAQQIATRSEKRIDKRG